MIKKEILQLTRRLLRGELRRRRRKRSGPVIIAVLTVAAFGIGQWLREPKAPLPAIGSQLVCPIDQIYDGDTVVARCDKGLLTVRVFGIDAPEMGQTPWGSQALRQLRNLIPPGSVRLEVVDIDRYGRAVARLYHNGEDLGLKLVRQGAAAVYTRYNDSRAYQLAQTQARQEQRGIWSRTGPQQEPWEWRKLNPR